MIMKPTNFGTDLTLSEANHYYVSDFHGKSDEAIINAYTRDDGDIIDYNYGYDSSVKPTPVSFDVVIKGTTEANMFTALKNLAACVGKKFTLQGDSPGDAYTVQADCTLRSISTDYTGKQDKKMLIVNCNLFRWETWEYL